VPRNPRADVLRVTPCIPEDGAKLGLQGMIDDVIRSSDYDLRTGPRGDAVETLRLGTRQLARVITQSKIEPIHACPPALLQAAASIKTHMELPNRVRQISLTTS